MQRASAGGGHDAGTGAYASEQPQQPAPPSRSSKRTRQAVEIKAQHAGPQRDGDGSRRHL